MKKITAAILCILMIMMFTACGAGSDSGQDTGSGGESSAGYPQYEEQDELFTFATETFEGEPFTSEDVKDAKLVMINLWEPWCGPCVDEMPDLEKIYEEYKDDGLVILGVFSDTTMDEDAAKILEEAGITYPILRASEEFAGFQTGYVPTTVFLTGEGKLTSQYPVIGSQSYDSWSSAVKGLLEVVGNE